jgi:hypothetical protein
MLLGAGNFGKVTEREGRIEKEYSTSPLGSGQEIRFVPLHPNFCLTAESFIQVGCCDVTYTAGFSDWESAVLHHEVCFGYKGVKDYTGRLRRRAQAQVFCSFFGYVERLTK